MHDKNKKMSQFIPSAYCVHVGNKKWLVKLTMQRVLLLSLISLWLNLRFYTDWKRGRLINNFNEHKLKPAVLDSKRQKNEII